MIKLDPPRYRHSDAQRGITSMSSLRRFAPLDDGEARKPSFRKRRATVTDKKMTSAEVRAKHKEFLFPSVANYYEESVVLESGKGRGVKDLDGKQYLDFFGGILTRQRRPRQREGERRGQGADGPPRPRVDALPDAAHRRARREARRTSRPGKMKKAFFMRQRHRGRRDGRGARAGAHRAAGAHRPPPRLLGALAARAVARRARASTASCRRRSPASSTRTRRTATAARSASSTRAAR